MRHFFVHERQYIAFYHTIKVFNFADTIFHVLKTLLKLQVVWFLNPSVNFTSVKFSTQAKRTFQSNKYSFSFIIECYVWLDSLLSNSIRTQFNIILVTFLQCNVIWSKIFSSKIILFCKQQYFLSRKLSFVALIKFLKFLTS